MTANFILLNTCKSLLSFQIKSTFISVVWINLSSSITLQGLTDLAISLSLKLSKSFEIFSRYIKFKIRLFLAHNWFVLKINIANYFISTAYINKYSSQFQRLIDFCSYVLRARKCLKQTTGPGADHWAQTAIQQNWNRNHNGLTKHTILTMHEMKPFRLGRIFFRFEKFISIGGNIKAALNACFTDICFPKPWLFA